MQVEDIEFFHNVKGVQHINIHRLRWLGHVVRMDKDQPARQIFLLGFTLKYQVDKALPSIGESNWRMRIKSRGAWKDVLKQAKI